MKMVPRKLNVEIKHSRDALDAGMYASAHVIPSAKCAIAARIFTIRTPAHGILRRMENLQKFLRSVFSGIW